jgi:hypothetical protein
MTPFRGEKNTGYEGAFRVPCLIRWPGVVKADKTTTSETRSVPIGQRPAAVLEMVRCDPAGDALPGDAYVF